MVVKTHFGKENQEKLSLNIGIVGGGRACKYFLELLRQEELPYLDIHLLGVCDINPEAEGFVLAKEMGLYTTRDFRKLFEIDGLEGIVELTNSRDVLLELIHKRPKRVGIIEHNIGRFIRNLYLINQRLESAEKQVLMEKMISEFLFQQARQRIVILNTDFTIEDVNDAYLESLGKKRKEVIGSYCYQFIRGIDMPCSELEQGFRCPMVETLRTGESSHAIHEDPVEGEVPAYIDIVTYPVKDSSGEIIRVIEIWRDITKEMSSRMEVSVRKMKSDLNKLVEEDRLISIGKLAASCVHEINNPIQGLLTFSYLMQKILAEGSPEGEDLEQLKQIASLMSDELDRCGNIVSGLLSFSRESSMETCAFDLNEVLKAVITLTQHKMELQGIEFNVELSRHLLMINGDPSRIQQCFLNLVFNAIEAMPSAGSLDIVSRTDDEKKNAIVEIRDTGYGIQSKHLDYVFDPFFTTKSSGEGTGLGLSIVYGIVKNHHGSIEVNSEEGKGTVFVLSFPMEAAHG